MATLIAATYEDELFSLNDKTEYITNSDTIIFSTNFNNKLDIELISNYAKIIFSDYPLVSKKYVKKNLFERYETNDFSDFSHRFSTDIGLYDSSFNQEVNHLPSLNYNYLLNTCGSNGSNPPNLYFYQSSSNNINPPVPTASGWKTITYQTDVGANDFFNNIFGLGLGNLGGSIQWVNCNLV